MEKQKSTRQSFKRPDWRKRDLRDCTINKESVSWRNLKLSRKKLRRKKGANASNKRKKSWDRYCKRKAFKWMVINTNNRKLEAQISIIKMMKRRKRRRKKIKRIKERKTMALKLFVMRILTRLVSWKKLLNIISLGWHRKRPWNKFKLTHMIIS